MRKKITRSKTGRVYISALLFGACFLIYFVSLFLNQRNLSLPGGLLSGSRVLQDCIAVSILAGYLIGVFIYLCWKYPDRPVWLAALDSRYLLCSTAFILLVAMGVSGYSLTAWTGYLPAKDSYNILFGVKRDITSDSWALSLPAIFNQIDSGFPMRNSNIMINGVNSVLAGLPIFDPVIISKPFMWGYLILGKARGTAWQYWMRFFLLFLSSYELLFYLCRKNKCIAGFFGMMITLAPAMQWWFTQGIVEGIISFQVCLAALFFYLAHRDNHWQRALCLVILVIFGSSFLLLMYPAFQVPLGYLFLLIAGTALLGKERLRLRGRDFIGLFAVAACALLLVWRYYSLVSGDLNLLMNTVYPASRAAVGGGYSTNYLFYSLFQWLLPLKSAVWENNSEVAAFLPLLPAILLLFPVAAAKEKQIRKYLVLLGYLLFLISWQFVRFPLWFAKGTGFSFVTQARLPAIIGLLAIYLAAIAADCFSRSAPGRKAVVATVAISFLCVPTVLLFSNGEGYLGFLKSLWPIAVVVACAVMTVMALSVCFFKNRVLVFSAAAVILFSGLCVNPISRGVSPLYQSALSGRVQSMGEADISALWLFEGHFPYSNYLLAQGVRSVNVHNSYPDWEKWNILDPKGTYDEIYNRYAHVSIELTQGRMELSLLSPDAILAILNEEDMRRLGVRYVVTRREWTSSSWELLFRDEETGFSIYRFE